VQTQKTAGPTIAFKRRNPRLQNSITGAPNSPCDYLQPESPAASDLAGPGATESGPKSTSVNQLFAARGVFQIPEKFTVRLHQHDIPTAMERVLVGPETAGE
jgi:hypothetical protein